MLDFMILDKGAFDASGDTTYENHQKLLFFFQNVKNI